MKKPWLSCKESARLLSQREDRALGFAERVALRTHLAICRGCRNASEQFRFLRLAMQSLQNEGEQKPG
jgi:hypothetical protein